MSHIQAIRRTVAAANSGNVALAKTHLQKAAEAAPEDAAVWLWLGWFAESPVNAVQCLEMAVEDERYRELANAGLAWARAMASFKLAEDGPVVALPQAVELPQVVLPSVVPVLQVEEPEHRAEKLLAANVAQVAAEVAEAVAVPVVAQVAAEQADFWDALESKVEAQSAAVPTDVEASASSELLTTIAALSLDPWTGLPPAASESVRVGQAFQPDRIASSNCDARVRLESLTYPSRTDSSAIAPTPIAPTEIAESPVPSSSAQPWSNAIQPRETGFGRASLWSGLGLGSKPDLQPEPRPIEPSQVDADSVAPEQVFESDHEPSPEAGVSPTTVTAIELPKTESANPAPTGAPGLWRAMKSSWFSSQPTPEEAPEQTLAVPSVAAERATEAPAPTTLQKPVEQPASQPESLFAWQRESVDTVPQPVYQATQAIEIAPAVDVFEEVDELTVEVPLTREARIDARVVDAAPEVTPAAKTILVVDDSPTVRKLVAMTLEKRGFKVVSAFDGVAAIKEIAAHNPALILMDINMPRLDGYQLCKLVKKHETTRNIPVVMLSGKDGMFDRLRGRLVGCSGYITKPFVPDELVDAVDEYLAQAACS